MHRSSRPDGFLDELAAQRLRPNFWHPQVPNTETASGCTEPYTQQFNEGDVEIIPAAPSTTSGRTSAQAGAPIIERRMAKVHFLTAEALKEARSQKGCPVASGDEAWVIGGTETAPLVQFEVWGIKESIRTSRRTNKPIPACRNPWVWQAKPGDVLLS
jgi:hypothetical protein